MPTYELKRGSEYLELVNPAEVFARIMVDYRCSVCVRVHLLMCVSYVELTGACISALVAFRRRNADCLAYRKAEIDRALEKMAEFIKLRQREDGR